MEDVKCIIFLKLAHPSPCSSEVIRLSQCKLRTDLYH